MLQIIQPVCVQIMDCRLRKHKVSYKKLSGLFLYTHGPVQVFRTGPKIKGGSLAAQIMKKCFLTTTLKGKNKQSVSPM